MAAVLLRAKAVLMALCLSLALVLSACSSSAGPITGNYVDDTVAVAQSLMITIALPQDDPSRREAEVEARSLINSYTARYRPQSRLNGLSSFTTMQTAMNSLAAHYAAYANRPLPDALKARLDKELKKAEASALRGA
ncbi:photosystem II protein Psb27 [Cyanobium sp. Morenito 9A2]|uniref:photosystem II protein Psb27 n=1 Tax=Cyanobium sp. Morenito 9A2 TaxID=2823718 RepID=UPI0020CE0B6B|nr:photosystem II protein Psb27 [Cyanobium sp. Morenito 9A2]MCP9849338.1 photosystem II protein Psb27 [Cyanobium sp. Morenito 9A2]